MKAKLDPAQHSCSRLHIYEYIADMASQLSRLAVQTRNKNVVHCLGIAASLANDAALKLKNMN